MVSISGRVKVDWYPAIDGDSGRRGLHFGRSVPDAFWVSLDIPGKALVQLGFGRVGALKVFVQLVTQ